MQGQAIHPAHAVSTGEAEWLRPETGPPLPARTAVCPGFKAFELEGLVQTCGVARPQRPSGWRPFTPQRVETKHDETFGSFGRTGHLAHAQRPRVRVAVELGSATGHLHGRNTHRAHGSRQGGSSSVGPAVMGSVACTTDLRVHVLCREQLILQGKGSGGLYKGCSPLLTQPASPLPARGGPRPASCRVCTHQAGPSHPPSSPAASCAHQTQLGSVQPLRDAFLAAQCQARPRAQGLRVTERWTKALFRRKSRRWLPGCGSSQAELQFLKKR